MWFRTEWAMMLQYGMIAFLLQVFVYLVQISHFTSTKALHHSWQMVSRAPSSFHLFYRKSLDQVHQAFFQFSVQHVLMPILILSFHILLFLSDSTLNVAFPLLTVRRLFCGFRLMKLPVEDLQFAHFLNSETLILVFLVRCPLQRPTSLSRKPAQRFSSQVKQMKLKF